MLEFSLNMPGAPNTLDNLTCSTGIEDALGSKYVRVLNMAQLYIQRLCRIEYG